MTKHLYFQETFFPKSLHKNRNTGESDQLQLTGTWWLHKPVITPRNFLFLKENCFGTKNVAVQHRKLKGQFHDFQWFFWASKKRRLLAQVSRKSDHDSSVSRVTTSPPKLSHANVVFRGLPLWLPLFLPTQNGSQKSPIIVTLPL